MDTPKQNQDLDASPVDVAPEVQVPIEGGEVTDGKPLTVTGQVIEALPNTLFRVLADDETEVLAYLSGKMRLHRIRVLIGDKVEIVPDPYGGRARIIRRL